MVESGKPNAAGWRLAGSLTTKASCLHQLQAMGEDAEEYAIIRNYTKGKTESWFSLCEYPGFPFQITDRMSNQDIAG
ncbi:hypothetical protein [uncultured Bacteroides sp.]|uniref:hypothetical protein n=1 Tax=uncultured Bacteroides sp. TaxID=162156 RepID=UPI0025995F51|nr:hypothetical protein [uncultured Bacteroides sp.]